MFFRLFAVFALLAVAFASPKPEPQPQVVTYSAAPGVLPLGYSAYNPVAYSAPYAAVPYAYSGYYVR